MRTQLCNPFFYLLSLLFFSFSLLAQDQLLDYKVISGPMPGHYTDSTASFWILVQKKPALQKKNRLTAVLNKLEQEFSSISYQDEPLWKDKRVVRVLAKKTPKNTPPKDSFSFLTGSCAFQYPLILNMFGKRRRYNKIFNKMAQTEAEFMVWTGDNVYYVLGQWNSYKGMVKKNLRSRERKPINHFLQSCPQYATWDDHDYGPNNSDANFPLKDTALNVFKKVWANPYYGEEDNPGVYSHFSQENCDFFLLDSRYYCITDGAEEDRTLFGKKQMDWLKRQLKQAKGDFKFIFSGTQLWPKLDKGDHWDHFPAERKDFLDFLQKEKIKGVVVISGDRHYSELNCLKREDNYPLYEYTCSPLTSFTDPYYSKVNDCREEGTFVRKQNYGLLTILGQGLARICRIQTFNRKGQLLWQREIALKDLQ
ncbi:alkaline phosphatase D family protein [Saprospira sp. CCB-QB6]|uniref:alkaline phosphatase D family protein n=1 Tax=Saprospira sp. CCB-QB6 TaxID=3023936 RepID=UPI00234B9FB2|nr:alkaline phosphatase D family protein [Saprospira sp. CCB-QB6]WCL82107.1 alkaline phosphatase D family protein [Saprospira sp. CCB-QB6]